MLFYCYTFLNGHRKYAVERWCGDMGLSPREPQKNPQYDWEWLDTHLKLHLKNPGSSVGIFPCEFKINREEIYQELIKNGYTVDRSNEDNWMIS